MAHRLNATIVACSLISACLSQDIQFNAGHWQTDDVATQRELRIVLVNEERFDTVYTELLDGSGMSIETSHTPLSRYEYDCDGQLTRRIQIRQESHSDTVMVEHLDGRLEQAIQTWIEDIPDGDYIEFYHRRKVKLFGHLNGLDEHGKPRKVGEWIEYDEEGNVVSRKNFP